MENLSPEEEQSILNTIKKFTDKEIKTKYVNNETTKKAEFPAELLKTFSASGFLCAALENDLGGMSIDKKLAAEIIYLLAKQSVGFSLITALHYAASRAITKSLLTDKQTTLINENTKIIPVFPAKVQKSSDPTYIFPLSLEHTNYILLCTNTEQMYLTDSKEFQNLRREKILLSGLEELESEKISIPKNFEIKSSVKIDGKVENLLSILKLYLSAALSGSAFSSLESALDYAKQRYQTGRMIINHKNAAMKIWKAERDYKAMQSFVENLSVNQKIEASDTDMLFSFACETSENIALESIQTLGGYGYMKDYGLEKKLRDIKSLQALYYSGIN